MNNAIHDGKTITITGPATKGVPVIVGLLLAIPVKTLASGEAGAAYIEGTFEVKKNTAAVIAQGVKINWESGASEFIVAAGTAGDLNGCAVALGAAGNGATTVLAKLTPGTGVAGT
ncbi:DUF2190 family protein [Pseudoxanthomonas mexicana]